MKYNPCWLLLFLLFASCTSTKHEEGELAVATTPVTSEEMVTQTATVGLPPDFDSEGHRGARGLKPENTLPAFETALDLGVTTLELDLHLTSDGAVVIWHDDAIGGDKCAVDPGAGIDVPDPNGLIRWGEALMISQLTLAEVQAYRCDRNPEPDSFPDQDNRPTPLAGDNYGIATLASLFEFVAAYSSSDLKSESQRANATQVHFNMETKRKPDSPKAIGDDFDGEQPGLFERQILDLVAQHALEDRVIIQSFDHRSLWAVRSINQDIRLSALTTGANADISGFAARGASIWSPRYTDLSRASLTKAHDAGLLVVPWTVNDPDDMLALIEMGVDGIISDRPDILLQLPQ